MKMLTALIVVLCLGMAVVVAPKFFTPIPEGGVCTADGQTTDSESLKARQVFWRITIFAPLITLLIGAFVILADKEETRGGKIGNYIFFASILVFILVLALSGA